MSGASDTLDTRRFEALLFVSDEPLTPAVLSQALDVDRRQVETMCERLQADLDARGILREPRAPVS